ncbi:hypothetical protein [Porphyromonas loveana]|uniref:hypothetical protein n=3 Tax=Porphyromonas loveana TaxID=1884669 RepID=UPI00359FB397
MDKMKNLCWFLFLLPLLGLSACKSKADEPQTPGSYIACYLEPDSVRIIEMGHGTLDGEKTVMWRYSVDATESQDFYHRGSEKYQELSILYGDTAFYDNMLPEDNPNRIERSRLELPFLDFNLDGATASPSRDHMPYVAFAKPVVSIDAVALDDYDDEHPEGSSLNDIASVLFYECWHYIQSGYQFKYHPYWNPFSLIYLSDYPEEPIKLMNKVIQFLLLREPATTDNHRVQLTYRFEGGDEVTGILETNKVYREEKYSEE